MRLAYGDHFLAEFAQDRFPAGFGNRMRAKYLYCAIHPLDIFLAQINQLLAKLGPFIRPVAAKHFADDVGGNSRKNPPLIPVFVGNFRDLMNRPCPRPEVQAQFGMAQVK